MKNGLLVYHAQQKLFNVGDYIQSLAAKQYLTKVDIFVDREKLFEYNEFPIKLILNGWFTHNLSGNWIPSKKIDPLFISFHLNSYAAPYLLNAESLRYLKKYEPIGCRDLPTKNRLKEKGIEAYFSGCLTLTLDSYKRPDSERTDNIYLVDPLYGYVTKEKIFVSIRSLIYHIITGKIFSINRRNHHIKKMIDKTLLKRVIRLKHQLPSKNKNDNDRFEIATEMLYKYATAKFVITSRIHCALPCLALGTPVVFINAFDNESDACRLDGLSNLFNRIDVFDTKRGLWKSNFNLNGEKLNIQSEIKVLTFHEDLAKELKDRCISFTSSRE